MGQASSGGTIGLPTLLRFVDLATDALAEAREEIDALNVYPVPDGDTGTNMLLTLSAARDAVREAATSDPDDPVAILTALSRGALLGARGNSGVILAQMIGAVGWRLGHGDGDQGTATLVARAIREATDASYAAVGDPVEGTILSVARAASDAAQERAAAGARARDVWAEAATAAHEALDRTPQQLQALADAGVVDAGGRGLTVVLDALASVLTGRRSPEPARGGVIPVPSAPRDDLSADGPAYEVMYLLDAEDGQVPALRERLGMLGDSVVVVGGGGLWNVHVHTDDVGEAVEAGIAVGRPHRIRVTHFAEQVSRANETPRRSGRAVVAVAAGPGLRRLFSQAGAVVVEGAPGQRPSTAMLLEAIVGSGSAEVIVLPNDPDSVRVAEIAARTAEAEHEVTVAVIHTQTQVEGLAAIAVHEAGREFHPDIVEMTATARHVRHGAVTVAAKRAMTMAGPCEPGQVLGVVSGDFAVVGTDLPTVAHEVLERLLASGGELVTLVTGADAADDLADRLVSHLEERHPHVDVVTYAGGQERYHLLLSVE